MTVPLYQLSDVWGDPSQRFSAITMDVQDGGHLTGSLLFDLKVNGISQFSVDPIGGVKLLSDLYFFRDSLAPAPGGALALRNGNVPQVFRVYNNYIDDSNYERGAIGWTLATNTLSIGTVAGGSGQVRPVQFVGSNFLISGASGANLD